MRMTQYTIDKFGPKQGFSVSLLTIIWYDFNFGCLGLYLAYINRGLYSAHDDSRSLRRPLAVRATSRAAIIPYHFLFK
jgi:hypothetical protein